MTTDRAPIRRPTLYRSRRSQHRSDQAKLDSKAARSHLRCAISPLHPLCDLASRSNPVASLSSFFSQFDRIWWIFFSRFCFFCVSVLTRFDEFFFWVLFLLYFCINRIWWIFFLGFVYFVFLYWGMILYICLAVEKMWEYVSNK